MRALALFALVACGPKVQPAWVEREAPLGTSHSGADTNGGTASPIDISKVDLSNPDALDEATVLTVLERIGDAAPAAAFALRAARLAHHRGDDGEARALLARAANAADEASVHAQLAELAKAVAAPATVTSTIAVLLPLSGRFAAIGSELRTAILSAQAETVGTTWLFVDTKGEADGAVAAVEQAYAKGALGILGPVGQREALAAARAAALRGMPIALLAPGDGADPAAGVFRLVDSPADEGRAAAHVAQVEGYPTVAVFAPRDDLGAESAEAFVAEAAKLGLGVATQGTYDPTGNVEADVKKFLNLVPSNPQFAAHLAKVGAKKAYTTFSPDIPYSLLYVPDRYDRAAIVAAFLPYYGVELRTSDFPDPERLKRKHGGNLPQVVQLVGGSGWNHPSLPIRGGMAVQGAMIVDTCHATSDQARDAAVIVAAARKDVERAADPRTALRERIARAKLDDGACGPAAMDVDGELHRDPSVLEVAGDQLIPAP